MAKSKNAVNDAALESAAGGAYGIVDKDSQTIDVYKDDKTYIGKYGVNEKGEKAIDDTLSLYGNNGGYKSLRFFENGNGPDKASQASGLVDIVSNLNKNKK